MRKGMVVVKEARQLMEGMSFFANRGAYGGGQEVSVSVDPHWCDDKQTIWVLITCYVSGHRSVDWTGVEVVAKGTNGKEFRVGLNQRGQGVLKGLQGFPYMDYSISLMISDEEKE